MSRIQFTARMLAAAVVIAALIVLLVLVSSLKPPLPNLSRSPTGPPALTVAKQIVDLIVWVLAVAVIFRLLGHAILSSARIDLTGSHPATARLDRTLAAQPAFQKRRWPLMHPATIQPYPLVVRSLDQHPPQPLTHPAPLPTASSAITDPPRTPTGKSVSILGPLKIEGARQRGRKLRSLTAQMLLYLVLHPEGANIETLSDVLLPETNPDQSRNRLWQSASEARRILGDGFARDDDGRYSLNRAAVHIDFDELGPLLNGSGHTADSKLETALALFRGNPLADVDWTWAEGHIRHLRATYVDLLEQVARINLDRGDPQGALHLAELGLNVDKLNEGLWRLAMEADFAVGLRDSVGQRYTQLRDLLDRELGLEPTGQTRGLYHSLLGQS